jgi:hypothetical protein
MLVNRPRNELGIAPLLIAAIPALISAVPGIISAVRGPDAPPPPPPCTFWDRVKSLFGGHPNCSN